jgi:TonB family protein
MKSMLVFPLLLAATLTAQDKTPTDVVRGGPNVTMPVLRSKTEPEYSPEGKANRIQGTVVLEVVVDERGMPTHISILSPLGFGLDENAIAALQKWRFEPGTKDGHAVKILASVEVNFRFANTSFDNRAQERRTRFNLALADLKRGPEADRDQGLEAVNKLSAQKYPAAMALYGELLLRGKLVRQDVERGRALLSAAAASHDGGAMYALGMLYWHGDGVPQDREKALPLLRDAAVLGVFQAQFLLGGLYELGNGVPHEPDRARRYFGLCAAKGIPMCELRLGKLLLAWPGRTEREYLQAIAWLQIAGAQSLDEAEALLKEETPKLSAQQIGWVESVKKVLVRQGNSAAR